jgi:hypothetical protein
MYRKKLCIKVKMTWGLKQKPSFPQKPYSSEINEKAEWYIRQKKLWFHGGDEAGLGC